MVPHHEAGLAYLRRFQTHIINMLDVVLNNGNPFEERNKDLVNLDNKVCESPSPAQSINKIEYLGQKKYNNFKENALQRSQTLMTTPIIRNNLQLFQENKVPKKSTLKQRVQHF